jgi:hypothetical protein
MAKEKKEVKEVKEEAVAFSSGKTLLELSNELILEFTKRIEKDEQVDVNGNTSISFRLRKYRLDLERIVQSLNINA